MAAAVEAFGEEDEAASAAAAFPRAGRAAALVTAKAVAETAAS